MLPLTYGLAISYVPRQPQRAQHGLFPSTLRAGVLASNALTRLPPPTGSGITPAA
ncbi:hypothetical protein [Dickeya aquatica]|uniref:Uncharacterized protein n=1 Tax=Dickeya aquatica TaxID=1401087 RepID=A0A375AAZ3_9GAMM|nr:hypothetical protein [Dickeya aquatica]SLM63233.1 hypothetical protein DAQ1742_02342 [Dickeya aquatica]